MSDGKLPSWVTQDEHREKVRLLQQAARHKEMPFIRFGQTPHDDIYMRGEDEQLTAYGLDDALTRLGVTNVRM